MNNPPDKTPFNSPRDPAVPPYHLRNGIADRAESDRNEAEHRRRMGMQYQHNPEYRDDRVRFDAWVAREFAGANVNKAMIDTMWIAWQAGQR